jgi:hypothetical protein
MASDSNGGCHRAGTSTLNTLNLACCLHACRPGLAPPHAPVLHQQHALKTQPAGGIQGFQVIVEQHARQAARLGLGLASGGSAISSVSASRGSGSGVQAWLQAELQHVHHPLQALRQRSGWRVVGGCG